MRPALPPEQRAEAAGRPAVGPVVVLIEDEPQIQALAVATAMLALALRGSPAAGPPLKG